jgi:hypothetical protein
MEHALPMLPLMIGAALSLLALVGLRELFKEVGIALKGSGGHGAPAPR